ncbi:MAG: DUF881 domain-containing protein [Eubacteriales bacterium]|nr:DUF881 domain-containing protein [Eubacteriales bacterium]
MVKSNKNKTISNPSGGKFLMFIIMLFLGLIISIQVKAIELNKQKTESAKSDIAYYTNLLNIEKEYTVKTTAELEVLREKKNELLEKALIDSGYTTMFETLQKINRIAGFTEVSGTGVKVILDDQLVDDPRYPALTSAIHDSDIRQVVDIMRSGGAIAIAVNGERVVSTSELTCNGPTVQINKRKYPVPYVITCVGDPVKISTLLSNDYYLNGRILSNIDFKMELSDSITIPAFSDYDKINQYIDALKGDKVS